MILLSASGRFSPTNMHNLFDFLVELRVSSTIILKKIVL